MAQLIHFPQAQNQWPSRLFFKCEKQFYERKKVRGLGSTEFLEFCNDLAEAGEQMELPVIHFPSSAGRCSSARIPRGEGGQRYGRIGPTGLNRLPTLDFATSSISPSSLTPQTSNPRHNGQQVACALPELLTQHVRQTAHTADDASHQTRRVKAAPPADRPGLHGNTVNRCTTFIQHLGGRVRRTVYRDSAETTQKAQRHQENFLD